MAGDISSQIAIFSIPFLCVSTLYSYRVSSQPTVHQFAVPLPQVIMPRWGPASPAFLPHILTRLVITHLARCNFCCRQVILWPLEGFPLEIQRQLFSKGLPAKRQVARKCVQQRLDGCVFLFCFVSPLQVHLSCLHLLGFKTEVYSREGKTKMIWEEHFGAKNGKYERA